MFFGLLRGHFPHPPNAPPVREHVLLHYGYPIDITHTLSTYMNLSIAPGPRDRNRPKGVKLEVQWSLVYFDDGTYQRPNFKGKDSKTFRKAITARNKARGVPHPEPVTLNRAANSSECQFYEIAEDLLPVEGGAQ